MVTKGQRRCAGATLSPINRDEVGPLTAFSHLGCEFCPELTLTNRRLQSDRNTRRPGQRFNEGDEAVHISECRVSSWALTCDASRNTSNCCDLRRHFVCRKQATKSGFCSLAQLDFNCTDWSRLNLRNRFFKIERTTFVATSEVAGPDLPNKICSVKVVGCDSTFTRGVKRACHCASAIKRFDRRTAE